MTVQKSAQSVMRCLPSAEGIFNCTHRSDSSRNPSSWTYRFMSNQYCRGFGASVRRPTMSMTEKNQRPSCHTRRMVCSACSSSKIARPVSSIGRLFARSLPAVRRPHYRAFRGSLPSATASTKNHDGTPKAADGGARTTMRRLPCAALLSRRRLRAGGATDQAARLTGWHAMPISACARKALPILPVLVVLPI